ncbi:MAG: CDP-archaeol synthase, partial [Thermoleophilaceae bacterium]|nr:CDP-archaeol synthase [Thermoleophilaceae bacterium]
PWGWALSVWDQADFVPFVVLLLLPVYAMPIEWAAVALVVVAAIHFAINVVGYAIGARKTLL